MCIFFSLLSFIFSGALNPCLQAENDCQLNVIHVQDFFESDTVSIIVNNDTIVSRQVVTSEPDIGLTHLRIKVIKNEGGYSYVLGKETLVSPVQFANTKVEFRVLINSTLTVMSIDLCKGGYIGFSKTDIDIADFDQSKRRFEYE